MEDTEQLKNIESKITNLDNTLTNLSASLQKHMRRVKKLWENVVPQQTGDEEESWKINTKY